MTAQCQRAPLDWAWPAIPVLVFCEDWPGFGPYHTWPCSSPRRHQCRKGGVQFRALGTTWTEWAGHQDRCEDPPW